MSLNYVAYPKCKKEIKKLYVESFPKKERFPFWILRHSIKRGKAVLNAILDDNKFIGMEYIVNCDDAIYLMFFAINKDLRNRKYGSRVLRELSEKYKTIFLSIEEPIDELSKRRKEFYLKNGFFEINKYCLDGGINYEILCSNEDYNITDEVHKKRYNNMTDSKIIRFIINRTF